MRIRFHCGTFSRLTLRWCRGTACLGTMFSLLAPHAFAQALVRGRAVDSVGSGIPSVEILFPVANRSTTTNPNGAFSFPSFPYGNHRVLIRKVGFRPIDGTVLISADTVRLDFTLFAATTRLPTVEGEAPASATLPPKPAEMPVEFNATGSECGVLALWTR